MAWNTTLSSGLTYALYFNEILGNAQDIFPAATGEGVKVLLGATSIDTECYIGFGAPTGPTYMSS